MLTALKTAMTSTGVTLTSLLSNASVTSFPAPSSAFGTALTTAYATTNSGGAATGTGATTTYTVSTLAGNHGTQGSADGTGSAAQFFNPLGIAVDSSGTVYVADNGNNTIRKVTSTGVTSTQIGTASVSIQTCSYPPYALDWYCGPQSVGVDSSGNMYVSDGGHHLIRKVSPDGTTMTTLAGGGLSGQYAGRHQGNADGTGAAALFYAPGPLAIDKVGNLYVTDAGNCNIRKVTPSGVVTTLAGNTADLSQLGGQNPPYCDHVDGTGTAAKFCNPMGIAVDSSGNIYVADTACTYLSGISIPDSIRKITPNGVVTTLTLTGGDLLGLTFPVSYYVGLALDSKGNIFVASEYNVWKITPSGEFTTLGLPSSYVNYYDDGTIRPYVTTFRVIQGMAIDSSDNIFLSDSWNNDIRKFTLTNQAVTLGSTSLTISNFSPSTAAVGTTVTITGSNFSTTAANNTVSFNGVLASVTSATATQLVVTVPTNATTGNITVTVGSWTATSATSFTVPANSVSPNFVSQGGLTWMPVTFQDTLSNANAYCTSTTINGQTGWRLPTQAELLALYYSGAMNGQGWTISSSTYVWSSAINGNILSLVSGNGGTSGDPQTNYVTCVR